MHRMCVGLDHRWGCVLGVETFDTTVGGFRRLVAWLAGFGTISMVGVEGTGSYGARLFGRPALAGVVTAERPWVHDVRGFVSGDRISRGRSSLAPRRA